ncbi:NB-ARC domain-containing protein [Streptomyces sp. NBC_01716]|uniref:NB-ARC domain-containing protein n=1 Tax=Streptomyces sp. NBC_01716 TaxID=2975917 RepID=UPI002E35B8EB|nr:NB-ARC domain-containing protein [Streptomyces sp. NBC_01716]
MLSRGRVWGLWGALGVCAAALVWLAVAVVRGGWQLGDQVASVLGGSAGILALLLALEGRAPAAAVGQLPGVGLPSVPEWVVGRAEVEHVVAALISPRRWSFWRRRSRSHTGGRRTVGITTGLHGAGGFGKTVLAHLVCADPRIRRHFGERVYLVTIGRDVRTPAAIAAKVSEVTRYLTGDTREVGQDPAVAGAHLGALLDQRPRMLLVLDDVWDAKQLAPFLIGGGNSCVRLVTTRNPSVLPPGAVPVTVDRMSRHQALSVVRFGLSGLPDPLAARLVDATGRWALLLRMANQHLAMQTATGADLAGSAEQLLERLERLGPASADNPYLEPDLDDPAQRSAAVRASIEAATELLPPGGGRRFAELGVFAADEVVPLPLVCTLWGATADLDEAGARRLCKHMSDLSLLTLDSGTPGGTLSLHDVVRDYLRAELGDDLVAVNARLLDAVATTEAVPDAPAARDGTSVPAWWTVSGSYLLDHLVEHLVDAGQGVEAAALASDLRWVRTRLHQRGPTASWRDLEAVGTSACRALARDIARTAHLLSPTDPPRALDDVLLSRLQPLPHWNGQVHLLSDDVAITNRWTPPDLPHQGLRRLLVLDRGAAMEDVVIGPEGTWLATSDRYGIHVWGTASGDVYRTLPDSSGGLPMSLSSDGTRLASSGYRYVRIWDTATGEILRTVRTPEFFGRAFGRGVILSPDGHRMVVQGRRGRFLILDVDTGRRLQTLDLVAERTTDSESLFPPPRGTMLSSLRGSREYRVEDLAFSPDGNTLAVAVAVGFGTGGEVQIWDTATGKRRRILRFDDRFGSRVSAVAIGPSGAWLAAGSLLGVGIWNVATGELVHTLNGPVHVQRIVISSDSAWLAVLEGTRVSVWDTETGGLRGELSGNNSMRAIAAAPDGTWLASAGRDGVRIWDVPGTGRDRISAPLNRQAGVWTIAVGPDGTWLATSESRDTGVVIRDTSTGNQLRILSGYPSDGIPQIVLSQDGTRLATHRFEHGIWCGNTVGGPILRLFIEPLSVSAMAFTSDNAQLRTAHWIPDQDPCEVRTWEVATGRLLNTVTAGRPGARALALSPDAKVLAVASHGGVTLYEAVTGEPLRPLDGCDGDVQRVAFSATGNFLATLGSSGRVQVWNRADGSLRGTVEATASRELKLALSADGDLIAVSANNNIQVLATESGALLSAMRTEDHVFTCEFGMDGRTLFVGTAYGLHGYDIRR